MGSFPEIYNDPVVVGGMFNDVLLVVDNQDSLRKKTMCYF